MGDAFNEKLCDERHKEITDNFKTLFNRLNWFYVFMILTLGGIVANYFKG
jgi:hypothetical protein